MLFRCGSTRYKPKSHKKNKACISILLNQKCKTFDIYWALYILRSDHRICPCFKAKCQKSMNEIYVVFHLFCEPEEAREGEDVKEEEVESVEEG